MFFTYVRRELLRRRRQALVVGVGLGLGIGLVVTVSAMASGVRDAQGTVLESLYGVGTDATVTEPARPGEGPGPARFGLNAEDEAQEGEAFSRDDIVSDPGLGPLEESDVETVAGVEGVRAASGALTLTSIHAEGTFVGGPGGGDGGGLIRADPQAAPSVPPIEISTFSIEGVDVASPDVGPVVASQIGSGRFFAPDETNAKVAVVDAGYASQEKLEVGDTVSIDGAGYEVVGIARSSAGGAPFDVAIPLRRAQALAGMEGKVNRIYVRVTSAEGIPAVQSAIEHALPDATVTTADDLASQVSGSLAGAADLAANLGRWLAIAGLVAAFALASLLTLSAVGRRVREFGTLKALGWRSRRVVGQVMGEALGQGALGAVVGIGAGFGGAALVTRFFPSLQASVSAFGAGGGGGRPGFVAIEAGGAADARGGGLAEGLGDIVSIPLHVTVSPELIAVAIGLALLGGLLTGSLGGWRAARLRPADALRRVD